MTEPASPAPAASPSPRSPAVQYLDSFDGTRLAWREMGEGRPVLLLHGFMSDAATNWIRYGHAAAIAATGRRCVMPDLRAHGDSARPHDAAAYPPDVLAGDALALIEALALTDYDVAGYSLGGRTVARMLAVGARPGRAVIAGMGLQGLIDTGHRAGFFARVLEASEPFERGSREWFAQGFLRTTGGDATALRLLLDSFVDTPTAVLTAPTLPVGVVSGDADDDNGSAAALADTIPGATLAIVPGNHMSAVTRPELGQAIARFLAG